MNIQEAVRILNEYSWRGRDDWQAKWFGGDHYAYRPDTWERDYLSSEDAIGIAKWLELLKTIQRITDRRPNQDAAAAAFFKSRQELRDAFSLAQTGDNK